MLNEFFEWETRVKPEIGHIGALLGEKLSDQSEELASDLREIEAWNGRCCYLLSEADSFLDRYSLIALPIKEGRTEKEREVLLGSETAPIRMVRDVLDGYCDCIKIRIELGRSLLSYQKQYSINDTKDNFKVL